MRAALYARVSQPDKAQDPDLQLRDLRTYVTARKWKIAREYVDHGVSGARDGRPALDALLADCRKRKVDVIVVWRLDRFGRSLKHLVNTLDELRALGIAFCSYHENLDFTTATGQLMFHLLAAFAQFERELIRERVKAGLANARAKGKVLGRPRRIFHRDQVMDLRKQGLSFAAIARRLGASKSLIYSTYQSSVSTRP